jgi:UDP-glucose 4-epimerase
MNVIHHASHRRRSVVTGAAGFIGSTLVDRLLAEGQQVIAIDNLTTGSIANLENALRYNEANPGRLTFLRVDVQAPELTDIVAGANPHVIFHLAAQVNVGASVSDPQFDARSNVLGTINLCEASRRAGVRRIVYAASGESRYGAVACIPADESTQVNPLSPYAVAKLAGEMYLRAYAGMYDLAPICLALASVYGPRQSPHGGGLLADLGSAMITGRPRTIYRDDAEAHDYVYVDVVVDAFVRAGCASMETTGIYNIGTGRHTTITELRDHISAVLDGASPRTYTADRGDELHAIALNPTKAETELGWIPAVNVAEGICRTIQWLCATLDPEPAAITEGAPRPVVRAEAIPQDDLDMAG